MRRAAIALATLASGCWTVWQGHTPDRRAEVRVHEVIDRQMVRVGGRNGPAFEAIGFTELVFDAGGERLAYPARERGRWRLVVDGLAGPAWAGIGEVAMSADGRHVAYAAEDDAGRWRVVTDGAAGPAFDAIHADTLAFREADGRPLLTYVASDPDGARLVANGRAGAPFDGIGALALDGRRLAYVARDGAWSRVVVGATVGPRYDEVPELVARAGRVAYVGVKDERFVLVIDGAHATGLEDELVALQVSATGRVACVRREGEREGVWIDGAAHPLHARVDGTTLRFSDDGARLAYVARDPDGARVVVDGVAGPAYAEIDGPRFDGAGRLAYVGRRAGESVVHVGAATASYPTWAGHVVTAGHRFAYLLRHGDRTAVVSDRGRMVFDAVIAETLTFDEAGRRWGVVAVDRDDAALRVVIEGGATRPLAMDELSALATQDPAARTPWAATEAVRGWVRAELAR